MSWREWVLCGYKEVVPKKKYVVLVEKYVEDARQDENHVPDLLESIMKPTDPVKEELRQKLFKINQFGSKIKKMRVSKFWIPEIQKFPRRRPTQPSRPVGFKQETILQSRVNQKNAGRLQALFTLVLHLLQH